ncbi:MAG: hypothetical protein FH748_11750 [Balneolaceae bacterium]|nr:hypothetical protein [Balneolaceae bacterium]
MRRLLLLIACLLLFLNFGVTPHLLAQEQDQQDSQNMNLSSLNEINTLGGVYIIDQMGIQFARQAFPYEQKIDKSTYVLGPNDIISLDIRHNIQPVVIRGMLVNVQGEIVLPSAGAISVAGKTIPEAETLINNRLKEQLKDPKTNISLDTPRPANISVTGPVPHPGRYVVPSQSRVDLAISQSITSGKRNITKPGQFPSDFNPNASFSFRNIAIERADGTKDRADLIAFYRTGDSSKNPIVKNGDRIHLRRLFRESAKISISGAVESDLELEYNPTDTPEKLINIAGGFETEADSTQLYIFRIEDGETQRITVEPNEWQSYTLKPNDRVIVPFNRQPNQSSSAWVHGEAEITGNFPIISGVTTAKKLLDMAGGLTDHALPSAAQLIRRGTQENEIPNKFNADLMKRTSDQLIQGLEYLDAETKLSKDRVYIDLNNPSELKQVTIFDGDQLFVPRDEQTLFVFGQVNNPGYYPFLSDLSVAEYIAKAGGFSLSADEDRVFILKAGNNTWHKPEDTTLESGDRIFVNRTPVEELNALRSYEIQQSQLKNQRTQLIMTAITTITGIITTYVAIQNIRN